MRKNITKQTGLDLTGHKSFCKQATYTIYLHFSLLSCCFVYVICLYIIFTYLSILLYCVLVFDLNYLFYQSSAKI